MTPGGGLEGRRGALGSDIPLYWNLGGRHCGVGGLGSVKVRAVAGDVKRTVLLTLGDLGMTGLQRNPPGRDTNAKQGLGDICLQ